MYRPITAKDTLKTSLKNAKPIDARPRALEQELINKTIFQELTKRIITPQSKKIYQNNRRTER